MSTDLYTDIYGQLTGVIGGTPATTVIPNPTTLGDAAWDYLPLYVRNADDGTLRALLDALGAPVTGQAEVVQDYRVTSDETVTPFSRIGWLAAMAGIDISTVPDNRKRAVVADATWRYRGSVAAIEARVGETLTGSKTVQIECPYEGDETAILVRTFTPETPDATATEAAVVAEVPAWLVLTFEVADGIDYTALDALYTTYTDMTTNGGTYNDLSNTQPAP